MTDTISNIVEGSDSDLIIEAGKPAPIKVDGVGLEIFRESSLSLPDSSLSIEDRAKVMRTYVQQVFAVEDKLQIVQSEALYEIQQNEYWKNWDFVDSAGNARKFLTFDEYVESELSYSRRKAYNLLSIYKKLVIELALPKEKIASIEWSKAAFVLKIIDSSNWADVIEKITTSSKTEVEAWAKSYGKPKAIAATPTVTTTETKVNPETGALETVVVETPVNSPTGTVNTTEETFKSFKVSLLTEQKELVEKAMKLAKDQTSSESPGHALSLICAEYLTSHAGSTFEDYLGRLSFHIENLEKVFGVKLEVKEINDNLIPAAKTVSAE